MSCYALSLLLSCLHVCLFVCLSVCLSTCQFACVYCIRVQTLSLFHANKYLFLDVEENPSASSQHRMDRADQLPEPKDAGELCYVMTHHFYFTFFIFYSDLIHLSHFCVAY